MGGEDGEVCLEIHSTKAKPLTMPQDVPPNYTFPRWTQRNTLKVPVNHSLVSDTAQMSG